MFDRLRDQGFNIETRNHAEAILSVDFPAETAELTAALADFRLSPAELIASGGGEAPSTQRLRHRLSDAGWRKHNFHIQTTLDGLPLGAGSSHEIDHIRRSPRGVLALEIEWNNKDPFFDRDLENFQRLHAQSVISLGIIVTRGASLQQGLAATVEAFLRAHGLESEDALLPFGMKKRTDRQRETLARQRARGEDFAAAFAASFTADKFGQATTHWSKLAERIARGVGSPCPLLLIGLPLGVLTEPPPAPELPPQLL